MWLGQPDPAPDGVDIFQLAPDRVEIDTGRDQIACFRFNPGALVRWYATCCNTQLFSAVGNPRVHMVGVQSNRIADIAALGPVRSEAFVTRPDGKQGHDNLLASILRLLPIMAGGLVSGRWRKNPLFDHSGAPWAPEHILTSEEKAKLPLTSRTKA